uniref:Uncharacterized protein n=1 Tax=Dendroctonus ponderosae TaxID=77166 RepID=A0AAR5QH26_DENPD
MHVYCAMLFLTVIVLYFCAVCGDLQSDIDVELRRQNGTSLLRKRRYLVFPEGSSFQVVYDLAYPSIDGIGFFVYGNTAALAWELPSTPVFLDKKFQKKEEPEEPTTMLPHLEHPDHYEDDWQPPESWEYKHKSDYGWQSKAGSATNLDLRHNARLGYEARRPVNSYSSPFQSYSRDAQYQHQADYSGASGTRSYSYKNNPKNFWDRQSFYNQRNMIYRPKTQQSYQSRMEYLDRQLHNNIHRRTRRDLYGKLQELFSTLMTDGKSCVLKIICQVHQTPEEKGSFVAELLKTIFKVKPNDEQVNEDQYDQAARLEHDCDDLYPKCKGNALDQLMSSVLSNKKERTQ